MKAQLGVCFALLVLCFAAFLASSEAKTSALQSSMDLLQNQEAMVPKSIVKRGCKKSGKRKHIVQQIGDKGVMAASGKLSA